MTDIEEKAYKDIRRELADKDRREYMSNWFAKDLDIIMNLLDNKLLENQDLKIKNLDLVQEKILEKNSLNELPNFFDYYNTIPVDITKNKLKELNNKNVYEGSGYYCSGAKLVLQELLDNGNKEVNMGIKIKNNVFKINEICYISIENKNNNYIVHIYLNNEVSPIDIIYKSEDEIYKDFLYRILQNNTFYTIDRYDIFNLRYIKSVTLNKINRKDSNNGLQLNILWNNQDLPKIFLFDNIDNIQYNAILADLERKL